MSEVETELKHVKITDRVESSDGSATTTYESYTDKLSTRTVTVERSLPTSQNTLYNDLLVAASVLRDTDEVTLKIIKKRGQPYRIVQIYQTEKEYHGK